MIDRALANDLIHELRQLRDELRLRRPDLSGRVQALAQRIGEALHEPLPGSAVTVTTAGQAVRPPRRRRPRK